jgi:hypothetical protein
MLKPSFKSIEGQSLGGVLLGGLACLYTIFTGDDGIPIDQVLAHAESAKEIAALYAQEATNAGASGLVGIGKAGVVLVFMYKMYSKFTDSRTDLKTTEIAEQGKLEVAKRMAGPTAAPIYSNTDVFESEDKGPSISIEKGEGDS